MSSNRRDTEPGSGSVREGSGIPVIHDREDVKGTDVVIEVGQRRTFARALDWPGWCRSGRDEDGALAVLSAAASRYAVVAAEAGIAFPEPSEFRVVQRLAGDGGTDFGAPGKVAAADHRPLPADEALRQADLVAAAWAYFDRVAAAAFEELRKGPRGGGRDRDGIVRHVHESEWSYGRTLGLRLPAPATAELLLAQRAVILDVLGEPSDGTPVTGKGWPVRYAAARIAWHVLDHAWEIEDRAG